jgi:uncharacterized protein YjeT (DUF2065 family)
MKAPATHFEQIPVETVKKIAQELPIVIEIDDATTETQVEEVTLQPKRWREMAEKVQVEQDPQKMMKLVEELITALDEEELRKSGKTSSVNGRPSTPAPAPNLHDPSLHLSSAHSQFGLEKTPDSLK